MDIRLQSKGHYFCCCCPIKIGIMFIAFSIFFLTIFYTFTIFMLWANRYLDIWYPLVLLILLAPLYYSSVIFFVYVHTKRA